MEAHILFGFLGGSELTDLRAVDSSGNPYKWYDPCKNKTREAIKNLTTEIARDLDIDGFNFDYIRYDENADISFSEECEAEFAQWLADQGKPPITDWPGPFKRGGTRESEFREWRVIPITNLVKDTREWMMVYKPNLEFSASTYTYWYGLAGDGLRYNIGQDPADWIAKGYLDFVSPMIYTGSFQTFKDYLNYDINYFTGGSEGKIPMVPFVCKDSGCADQPNELNFSNQVNYSRQVSDGIMIWRYGGPGVGNTNELTDIRTYLNKVNETNPDGWFDTFTLQNVYVETINDTSVLIKWSTTLPTTSIVEYNTTPLFVARKKSTTRLYYWDMEHVTGYISSDNSNVTSHSITLTGLQKGIPYYYRVQSRDNFELLSSKVYNFTIGQLSHPVNVSGVVTDYDTGSPISGATVTCDTYTTTTDSSGGYFIKMLIPAPGSCSLKVTKPSYVAKSVSSNFTENKTYGMNFELDKIRYKIYGELRNTTNAIQATIIVYQQNNVVTTSQTDSNGNYTLTLMPGMYDVQYNITNFYIPNLYIRVPSLDMRYSEVYDAVKSVTGNVESNNISIILNMFKPKTVQISSNSIPTRVSQNGSYIKNVSSLSELKNNSWFYEDSSIKRLNIIVTPWPVPLCGNKICEDSEKETSDLYYCPTDCPVGLLGYWKFDEGTGNIAYDSSGYGNDGTLYNDTNVCGNPPTTSGPNYCPTWVTNCVHGKCLSFNGVDDYVTIKKFGDYWKGFSIEFWFNMMQSSVVQRPFSSDAFSTCYIDPRSTTWNCYLGNGDSFGGGISSKNWTYNSWNHFTMTYDVSTGAQVIYRNGTSVATSSYDKIMIMKKGFAISSLYWESGFESPFYGMIDEFAIYNRALTPQEVMQHYQNGIS
jgi:hypothetical protein